jgi:hypothetical protein
MATKDAGTVTAATTTTFPINEQAILAINYVGNLLDMGKPVEVYSLATKILKVLREKDDRGKIIFECETEALAAVLLAWLEQDRYVVTYHPEHMKKEDVRDRVRFWKAWNGDFIVITENTVSDVAVSSINNLMEGEIIKYYIIQGCSDTASLNKLVKP